MSNHNSGTPSTDLPQNLIGWLGRPTGMFSAGFKIHSWVLKLVLNSFLKSSDITFFKVLKLVIFAETKII